MVICIVLILHNMHILRHRVLFFQAPLIRSAKFMHIFICSFTRKALIGGFQGAAKLNLSLSLRLVCLDVSHKIKYLCQVIGVHHFCFKVSQFSAYFFLR